MPGSRRVTIAEVAEESGVGVGTVSRVINGAANVRHATRVRVQKVIGQLGYRPSHMAASLSRGTARTVAIVIPHLTRPAMSARLAGALAVLDTEGYDTVVCNVDTPEQRDRHLDALAAQHRADGVMIVSLPLSRPQLGAFRRAAVPLVAIDVLTPGVPQTITDDVLGGRMATEHLLALGHRRIGFVGDEASRGTGAGLGFSSSARRLTGYRQALGAARIRFDSGLVRRGPHGAETAAELTTDLLGSAHPPSAIFAASDTQALAVLTAAAACGVTVPGELSVVGFDDIEAASLLGLTTVAQPLEFSGGEGARRLCALLRGEQVKPLRQQLSLEVIQRSSSAAPTAARPAQTRPAPPGPASGQEQSQPAAAAAAAGPELAGTPHPLGAIDVRH